MSHRIPSTHWLTAFLVLSHFGCTADRPEGRRAASEAVEESDPLSHVFTYSILETDPTRGAVFKSLEALAIPTLVEAGATPYSVWLPVGIPDPDRFRGEALSETQLVLMLAWPQQDVQISRIGLHAQSPRRRNGRDEPNLRPHLSHRGPYGPNGCRILRPSRAAISRR